MLLKGNAYISGAASGIGRATALLMASSGAKGLALADRNWLALNATRQEIQTMHPDVDIACYTLDLCNEQSIKRVLSQAFNQFGRLDYAVNNAGIAGPRKPSVLLSTKEFQETLDVNLTGLWVSQREQLRHMIKQELLPEGAHSVCRGVIVNTASMASIIGGENITAYIASKHGVLGTTKGDAATYAKDSIRINCVCPGFVKTPMLGEDDEILRGIAQHIPMKRIAAPEEVASAILFLASPLSSYLSGAALTVDGGFTTV